MKRFIKVVGIAIGALLLMLIAVIAPAFLGHRAIVDGFNYNGVHIIKDGFVSVALIPVGDGQVALIDAGNDKAGKAILAELSRRHLGPDAVSAILLTHGHPDHTAAIPLFPKAQLMALAPEVGLVEGRERAHGPLPRLFPPSPNGAKVTQPLQDGQTFLLGQVPVQVFAVPGHTAGSAAYLVNGVLFLGDAADSSSDGKIVGSAWVFSDSQPQDRASLVRLDHTLLQQHADVKALAFAHSGMLLEGLAPLNEYAQAHQ